MGYRRTHPLLHMLLVNKWKSFVPHASGNEVMMGLAIMGSMLLHAGSGYYVDETNRYPPLLFKEEDRLE